MSTLRENGQVKSARRVLELFEYFNNNRQSVTVMEIARRCGYPQSSVSKLLSCLAGLGYLHHDRASRTYRPTARVALLGAWVQPHLFRHGLLLTMIDELSAETGCEVQLGTLVGLHAHIIEAVAAGGRAMETSPGGIGLSLARTAMGRALLAALPADQARGLVHRLNAAKEEAANPPWAALQEELVRIRAQDYALAHPEWDRGASSCCVLVLPCAEGEDQLALCLRPPTQDTRSLTFFLHAARGAIARHLSAADDMENALEAGPALGKEAPARTAAMPIAVPARHTPPLIASTIRIVKREVSCQTAS